MVEGGTNLLTEKEVLEAIWFGHQGLQPLLDMQEELAAAVGKPKRSFDPPQDDEELLEFGFLWLRYALFGEKTMKVRPEAAAAAQKAAEAKEK